MFSKDPLSLFFLSLSTKNKSSSSLGTFSLFPLHALSCAYASGIQKKKKTDQKSGTHEEEAKRDTALLADHPPTSTSWKINVKGNRAGRSAASSGLLLFSMCVFCLFSFTWENISGFIDWRDCLFLFWGFFNGNRRSWASGRENARSRDFLRTNERKEVLVFLPREWAGYD